MKHYAYVASQKRRTPYIFPLIVGNTGSLADATYEKLNRLVQTLVTHRLKHRTCSFELSRSWLTKCYWEQFAKAIMFPVLQHYTIKYQASAYASGLTTDEPDPPRTLIPMNWADFFRTR